MNTSDIITRIKNSYIKQNRKRKQISDYILSNISACCFHPLKKLAEEAGTTEVTLLSYCRSHTGTSLMKGHGRLEQTAMKE